MALRPAEVRTPLVPGGRLASPIHDSCNESLTDVTSQSASSETGSTMTGWDRTGSPPLRAHHVTKSFQPQPPPADGRVGPLAGRRYLRQSTDRTRRLTRRGVTSEDVVPFSQEETSKPALTPTPATGGATTLPPVELSPGEVVSLLPPSTGGSSTDADVERRMREGVISGLEYFEKRTWEMREIKDRLVRELDRVTQINRELEESIGAFMKKINVTNEENDELKVRLDRLGKDNGRLQEQAKEEWRARKKAEELYVQCKASSDEIAKSLRENLDKKETDLQNLKRKLELYSQENSKGLTDDKALCAELHSRIEALKQDNKLVVSENELLKNQSNKLKAEVENLKTQVGEKNTELERQFSRFLTLKKGFNDIREENERLRSRTSAPANVTWPRDAGRSLPPTSGTLTAHAGSTSVSSLCSTTTGRSTQAQCKLPPAQPYGGRRRGVGEPKGASEGRGMPEGSLPPVKKDGLR